MRRPDVPFMLLAPAAVLVVVGALVVVTAPPVTVASSGYTPVGVGTAAPGTAVWTTRAALGAGAVVLGALLASVAGGHALVRRRRARWGSRRRGVTRTG